MPDIDLPLIPYRIRNHAEPLFRGGFADHALILFLKNGVLRHSSHFKVILNGKTTVFLFYGGKEIVRAWSRKSKETLVYKNAGIFHQIHAG